MGVTGEIPVFSGSLAAVGSVFMQFDADAVRIGQPGLPGMIGAHLLLADRVACRGEPCVDGIDGIGFQRKVIEWIGTGFHRFAPEKFEKIAVADPQVEADDFAVTDEIERFCQSESIAVETGGSFQISDPDAEMAIPLTINETPYLAIAQL